MCHILRSNTNVNQQACRSLLFSRWFMSMKSVGSFRAAKMSVLTFKLSHLGLLIRRKDLEKCRLGFGMAGNHLGRQIADGGCSLINGGRVIGFDSRAQT